MFITLSGNFALLGVKYAPLCGGTAGVRHCSLRWMQLHSACCCCVEQMSAGHSRDEDVPADS